MTIIACSRTDCLNLGMEICTAAKVEWSKGKCNAYITARHTMKANAPSVKRRNGVIIPKQCRPFK